MYRIRVKTNDGENNFDERILPNEYNYEKLAVNTMLVLGQEEKKKQHAKLKRTLSKKEKIELLYDKSTQAASVAVMDKKKPVKILVVLELVKEEDM